MDHFLDIIHNFPKKKIVVIGDVMLDEDIVGDVSRISPEAPVQVLNAEKSEYGPGGAANVASNLASLDVDVSLFGFIGKDKAAQNLLKILEEKKIKCFFEDNSITILKQRIKSGGHQLIRIDYEESNPKQFSPEIKQRMREEIFDSDLVIVSDYAKGAVTEDLMNFLRIIGKKIIVDPKPKNMDLYSGVYLITPNEKEALEMSNESNVKDAGRLLREKLDCNVLVTRGEKGMALFSDKEIEIPTYVKEIKDISGAGDTVIATMSLAIFSGASLEESAIIANHAAGIAVSKAGVSQVKLNELKRMLFGEEQKLKTFDELSEIVNDLKKKQRQVVWTNGAFDVPHAGHLKCLKAAKEQGDYLIVGLNSDSSVRMIKGPSRPVNPEDKRAEFLASLPWVDYIIIYSESEPTKYLSAFKPEVYAKGGDYNIDSINQNERKIIENYGGRIALVGGSKIDSSTDIIKRIQNKNEK